MPYSQEECRCNRQGDAPRLSEFIIYREHRGRGTKEDLSRMVTIIGCVHGNVIAEDDPVTHKSQ